jgi:sugar lactone lactonase YvrE
VTTLAGNGTRGTLLGDAADAQQTSLASPWDVELLDQGIAFANAGTHQLGLHDAATGRVMRLAGSGREAIHDGPADEAALAQPSALALSPDRAGLYFLDAETSSLRALDLGTKRVTTLIGSGLFDFGHHSGIFAEATLQHPLGLAMASDRLYIADSYNDSIRCADLASGNLLDLDDGFLCRDPLCLALAEPAGIAVAASERLLLVDTNNHRVLEYDLAGCTYHTWLA